jgi:hypothetical protein
MIYRKSFSLIELLVSVAIFTIVCVVVIAILTVSTSSKSKLLQINEIKDEGSKIMLELQNLIEKGNSVGVINSNGEDISGCGIGGAAVGVRTTYLETVFNNFNPISVVKTIKYDDAGQKIILEDVINDQSYQKILHEDKLQVTYFSLSGKQRKTSGCNNATTITINFTLEGKPGAYSGQTPTLHLQSTFTSHYPYPDQGGDST